MLKEMESSKIVPENKSSIKGLKPFEKKFLIVSYASLTLWAANFILKGIKLSEYNAKAIKDAAEQLSLQKDFDNALNLGYIPAVLTVIIAMYTIKINIDAQINFKKNKE